jgi:hypothetical protein
MARNSRQVMLDNNYTDNQGSLGTTATDLAHLGDASHQWVANQIYSCISIFP